MAVAVFTSFDQISDSNGLPVAGGTVTVYAADSTTPLALYTDSGLSISTTNPITLDASGRHPSNIGMVYISPAAYKVLVKKADGSTLYVRDFIDPGIPIGSGALAIANGGTGSTTASGALAALGAATAPEVADLAAEVASLAGAAASTEKTHIATGTTAQRDATPDAGDIRHNTTTSKFEGYIAAWWNFFTGADIATQSDQETATSTATVVTPGRQKYHPTAIHASALVTVSGGTPTLVTGVNVSSVTDNGAGDFTINFTDAFGAATYRVVGTAGTWTGNSTPLVLGVNSTGGRTTTSVRIIINNATNGNATDPNEFSIICNGDLA